jgi:cyclic pyranopterin phosphate synthase
MPEEGYEWMPKEQLLSYEEILTLVRVFVSLGIRSVRLTGGEPTLRKDLVHLVQGLSQIDGLEDLAMTTNAFRLASMAEPLARAGLSRINVSLDSLSPKRFEELTRGGRLSDVLEGISASREAGLGPVKINAVVLRGVNDDEVVDWVAFFSKHASDTVLRFIEYMPFETRLHQCVTAQEILDRLGERYTVTPLESGAIGRGPARRWVVEETGLELGFIAPLSERFCAACNRLRLMADGHLRTCLAHDDTPSLLGLVRDGASDAAIEHAIRWMVFGKPEGHFCETDGGEVFGGVMTQVGG